MRVSTVLRANRDTLLEDQIDFSGEGVGDHGFEAFTVFGAGASDAFVGVHACEFPLCAGLDVARVVVDLCLV